MRRKPIIGVSANWAEDTSRVAQPYLDAIAAAGGVPIILPITEDESQIEQYVSIIDALVMTGGGDIDPQWWGEAIIPESGEPSKLRDTYDINLYRSSRIRQLPILGICRGMQVMNVAEGGSVYQDIYVQINKELLNHNQQTPKTEPSHEIDINPSSKLASIIGCTKTKVNTIHHQAVRDIADVYVPVAFSPDGVCEAIESEYYPMIGVQWHPEHLRITQNRHSALFEWIVSEAAVFAHAKSLHEHGVILDSHTDTPMVWTSDMNLGEFQQNAKVDFAKMACGLVDAVFMVAYLPQGKLNKDEYSAAYEKAVGIFENIKRQVHCNSDQIEIATSPEDIECIKLKGKRSVIAALENGYALAHDIDNLRLFYDMGVRYVTLCHNGDNDICDSAKGEGTHNGLSDFGLGLVKEMNRMGMIIDISHAADETMRQVINLSEKPVVATHSCARALCSHGRNLPDDILHSLAAKGGVCQICSYGPFLSDNGVADVDTIVQHIDYIVNLIGIDHVGIGSDFDGGGGVNGCQSENELINITKALINRGYDDEDILKIMGGNFIRVWKDICKI